MYFNSSVTCDQKVSLYGGCNGKDERIKDGAGWFAIGWARRQVFFEAII